MCHYLANQEHCVRTPRLPAASPDTLLREAEQVRSGRGPLSPYHGAVPNLHEPDLCSDVDLGSVLSVPSSSGRFYSTPPFPIHSTHTLPVSLLVAVKHSHVFLCAKVTTVSSETSSETPTPSLQRFLVITCQPAPATSEPATGDALLPSPISFNILQSRH